MVLGCFILSRLCSGSELESEIHFDQHRAKRLLLVRVNQEQNISTFLWKIDTKEKLLPNEIDDSAEDDLFYQGYFIASCCVGDKESYMSVYEPGVVHKKDRVEKIDHMILTIQDKCKFGLGQCCTDLEKAIAILVKMRHPKRIKSFQMRKQEKVDGNCC